MDSHIAEMEEIHQPQQVGPNMMATVGGIPNHSNNVSRRNRIRSTIHSLMIGKRTISEAAQLEMKSLSNKTPISILQELLSRRGTTPKYELIQVEGAIHEPIFRYRVTVADVVDPIVSAMGTGKSKKEAKHAAARAVLDKLCRLNSESPDSPLPNNLSDSENLQELSGYGEEKIITNPIGALQEMCMSRHWPPPKYTIENEEGLPHERQFTIVCSVLKYREHGQGKSKKVAKRHAAHKMWQALHYMNTESSNIDEDEVLQRNANVSARYADLKGSKISTLTTIHSLKVSQFHKSLKSSTGVKLFELQNAYLNDGDVNLVQFLQEIASEQQFEVTYVDIEEKSISGKYQCLVQLSTLPVAVCYGCGVTSKDAQASAAQNALEYLKIMTKK
ncbi:interferon-inducible double-stranded RNA-dependent protein kinase activator A homolog isoform X1 [Bombus affinis]|uniref:Interferon-inducible double-stranded RNA-dependent protein kinase activator A homolog isoform X1 n=2 Tax=Bombus terrestris TaxID=30195 RepID=A0A9B0C3Q4_BOMTE|nr:interferon-inducible double-stranded RNA-dependent protein kinase activator A homolog isoform X1 [Bombus terrestris]XP_050580616.1 interferon-inducible double-stranded RNA-dependent protein kinase activator A homolog isoform X1 [Bombus affinis]